MNMRNTWSFPYCFASNIPSFPFSLQDTDAAAISGASMRLGEVFMWVHAVTCSPYIYIYMHVDYIIYVYTNTYALCIFNNNHVYNQKIESIWPVGTADAKVLGRHHAHIGL